MNDFRRRRTSGLSLVEMMIASMILAIVMLMVYLILEKSTATAANGSIHSQLSNRGREFLQFAKSEFIDAKLREPGAVSGSSTQLLGIHADNTWLHYEVPVRTDPNGAMDIGYDPGMVTGAYVIQLPKWPSPGEPNAEPYILGGRTARSVFTDFSCVIRFEADTILRERNAPTTTVNQPSEPLASKDPANGGLSKQLPPYPALTDTRLPMDINKDGSLTGIFVSGKIVRYVLGRLVPNATPNLTCTVPFEVVKREKLSDEVILAVDSTGKFKGMVGPALTPADALQDCLFKYIDNTGSTQSPQPTTVYPDANSKGVAVVIWHGKISDDGKYFMLNRSAEKYSFKFPQ